MKSGTIDYIFIEGLRVDARVGIYPREQVMAQTLEIDLTFGLPPGAADRDNIADTIDYAKVVARIRESLAERHFKLLESLGEFVVGLLFEEFQAPWVRISIAKIGVIRGARKVGVLIERSRDAI